MSAASITIIKALDSADYLICARYNYNEWRLQWQKNITKFQNYKQYVVLNQMIVKHHRDTCCNMFDIIISWLYYVVDYTLRLTGNDYN